MSYRSILRRGLKARARILLVGAVLVTVPGLGDGRVTGHARFERIRGHPQAGYAELYESNLFLCPDGGGPRGPSFRLGAPPGEAPRGDGYYSLDVPAGSWSLLVNQPLFFIRPRVISDLLVRDGQTTIRNVELPIDYSTYFTDSWTSYASTWIQTFEATGWSITGVSWKLAGTNASDLRASVHADNGDANPARWPLVDAAAAKSDSVASLADNWVRWRSGEVPTTPGRRYAIQLTGVSGGDRQFAVFKRDKDGQSYSGGRAYSAQGSAQGFDLNITVFSDNDGTAVLYNKTTEGLGELRDGYYGGRWGQTFRATKGVSLAAVDVWAAGADRNWDLDFSFQVYRGGPPGDPVGPLKRTRAAFQAFGAGLHAVSYNPGEVPLEAGELYYVEFRNSPGFNPYVMDRGEDAYPGGAAYQDGVLKSGGSVDLSMTIVVYTEEGGSIAGTVRTEGTGAAVAAAEVLLTELGRSVESAADGSYELVDVPEGSHTLRVSRAGFSSVTVGDVVVTVGQTTRVDVSLAVEDCSASFRNPGFESGLGGWSRYGDARNEVVDTSGGGWFGGIVAREGQRFHGNAINGCCLNGGLYQRHCSIPGHRYRVTAWSNVYWISGNFDDARNRLGVDPDGGIDPDALVVWSSPHRQAQDSTEGWRQLEVEVEASGSVFTIFLDFAQEPAAGNVWRINCFDGVEVEDLDAVAPLPRFRRGDCSGDGEVDISDAIFDLTHLFLGGEEPGCDDACDANDDGVLDISDPLYLLGALFLGTEKPPQPGLECGEEATTQDGLDCERSPCP